MTSILSAARANLVLAPTGILLAIVSSTLIARWLGPEIFADYATLTSLLAWVLLLSEAGCNNGIGRYLPEAAQLNAQGTLYTTLQRRRWLIVSLWSIVLLIVGPFWAESSGLPAERWNMWTFFLISLLSGAMLHNQLANAVLLASFNHRKTLLISQIMIIVRAVLLSVIAGLLKSPVNLIFVLLCLAAIEAVIIHDLAKRSLAGKNASLPPKMANTAQRHGLVSIFDKMTSALSGGAFLILILTSSQSRIELAMLAVSTDALQKVLGVIGLPLSNIIIPIFNESRNDESRFKRQVARLGGLTTVLFSIGCGGLASILLAGLPLLLGRDYTPATSMALIWIAPLFFEAGVRMVWGTALLSLDHRRWLMYFNSVFGLVTLAALLSSRHVDIHVLLLLLGGIRIIISCWLLHKAHTLQLLSRNACPLGIVAFSLCACLISLAVQYFIDPSHLFIRLVVGGGLYSLIILAGLRFLPLVPPLAFDAICHLAGRFSPFVLFFIPRPTKDV